MGLSVRSLCANNLDMQKLIQHIKDANLTLREFARREGISPSFLSEITATDPIRRKSPSLGMALRLQRATDGAVCVHDWPKLAEVADAVHGIKVGGATSNVQGCTPKDGAA